MSSAYWARCGDIVNYPSVIKEKQKQLAERFDDLDQLNGIKIKSLEMKAG